MRVTKLLPSLSIFFPFYNDEGTVGLAIEQAYYFGRKITNNLEVIALHGGNSRDQTWVEILKQKKRFPDLKVINKCHNIEGYAVIKCGFEAASKDWVFYTDGDLQYKVAELSKLVKCQQKTGATVVNGYKYQRLDSWDRRFFGGLYQYFAQGLFQLPISDVDCDFRLIKTSLLKKIKLQAHNASILPELILKLKQAGAVFTEVSVTHLPRRYGKSNYSVWRLLNQKLLTDLQLWWSLR